MPGRRPWRLSVHFLPQGVVVKPWKKYAHMPCGGAPSVPTPAANRHHIWPFVPEFPALGLLPVSLTPASAAQQTDRRGLSVKGFWVDASACYCCVLYGCGSHRSYVSRYSASYCGYSSSKVPSRATIRPWAITRERTGRAATAWAGVCAGTSTRSARLPGVRP